MMVDSRTQSITQYCADHQIDTETCVQEMRATVYSETQLTVSAGIAPNKVWSCHDTPSQDLHTHLDASKSWLIVHISLVAGRLTLYRFLQIKCERSITLAGFGIQCLQQNKPNGQFHLPFDRASIKAFMHDLSIRKVPGVGRVHERLLDAIGIKVHLKVSFVRITTDLYFSRLVGTFMPTEQRCT